MACPEYGSTSKVSLYYTIDADPSAALTGAEDWYQVRMTGESLDLNLTSTISDEITPQRSFANSKLTQGEVTGGFTFDASVWALKDFLICALQDSTDLHFQTTPWADNGTIKNGSSAKCLMFLKIIDLGSSGKNYYIYRGCQISSLSLNMEPGALVSGEVTVMGVGASETDTDPVTTGSYNAADSDPLMSGVDSVKSLTLKDSSAATVAVTFQNLSVTFDNQLRQQFAIGTNSIYAAGTGSGRFMCTLSSTQYYGNHAIYDAITNDEKMSLTFSLTDSAGNGFDFNLPFLKVQSGAVPLAGGPDADLLISPEMQAFEDSTYGTVTITADFDNTP